MNGGEKPTERVSRKGEVKGVNAQSCLGEGKVQRSHCGWTKGRQSGLTESKRIAHGNRTGGKTKPTPSGDVTKSANVLRLKGQKEGKRCLKKRTEGAWKGGQEEGKQGRCGSRCGVKGNRGAVEKGTVKKGKE